MSAASHYKKYTNAFFRMEAYEMINGGDNNVYHLLFYMISNFMTTCYDSPPIYYYYKPTCKLAEEFLALLPPAFIHHTEKNPTIDYIPFNNRITFCKYSVPPIVYSFIHYLFRPYCKPSSRKKIYIARKPTRPRHIINQDELIQALSSDFRVVYLEEYSVKEQIEIVSEASVVIGPHGAGLAYTVFCEPGTLLIEILGEPLCLLRHYKHLADCMGHTFFRFDLATKLENEHMHVDIQAFKELLNSIAHLPQSQPLVDEYVAAEGCSDPLLQSQLPL